MSYKNLKLFLSFKGLSHWFVKWRGSCRKEAWKNKRPKWNTSQSRRGELVYNAINIKEIGLHQCFEWREVIDAKLG